MTAGLRRVFEEHRAERAQELVDMANILDQQGLTPNSGPIRNAAYQCQRGTRKNGKREYWGFEIADLRINLEAQQHVRPTSAVMDACRGVLSATIEEYVPGHQDEVGRSFELLRKANVDFHLDAYHEISGEKLPLRAAWHLDAHVYSNPSDHGVHPSFHFQVGGNRLKEIDAEIRGVLMPEAPRLYCAPLDAILAVDFVLAQYCGKKWSEFKDILPSYLRLRKNPLQRYWLPYFRTLADGIDNLLAAAMLAGFSRIFSVVERRKQLLQPSFNRIEERFTLWDAEYLRRATGREA
jgi:hypothetical protein